MHLTQKGQNVEQISISISKILKSKVKNSNSKKISNYQIREKIGMGSYATVYKAIHLLTQEIVAVKVFKKIQMSEQEINNIFSQVKIHKKLLHTNIVRLYEYYEDDEKIYIFMEYCQKGQLFTFINQNGQLTQTFASKIFKQILSALKYMKSQRIFHRDIKCENIMFDKNWNAKLVDFGFATQQQLGAFSKTFCGSSSYTAPQIANKQKYKAEAVDIWCLGVTLYAMLSGRLPFDGKTHSNTRDNIKEMRYQSKKYLSDSVKSLFNQIFVQNTQRSSLEEIQETDFFINGPQVTSNFINFNTDEISFDSEVLKTIKQDYKIESLSIIQSITKFKLDSKSALYFLLVKKQLSRGRTIKSDIGSSYFDKKKKRSNTVKLIKFEKSGDKKKIVEKQLIDFRTTQINMRRKSQLKNILPTFKSIDLNSSRIRLRDRKNYALSPKRILDKVSAYRPFTQFQ